MALPFPVEDVIATYLRAIDAEADGLIEGLYLEGSVALGDFRPRTSDIDFVAVTAASPQGAALAALERVHARLRYRWPRPFFDGVYLTWDDLRAGPASVGSRLHSHEGRLHTDAGPVSPVTWHTIADHGVICRGPAPAVLDLWRDPRALAAWTDDNLDRYWRRLCERACRPLSAWGLAAQSPYGAVWVVTGVARLHYTLATGGITSKDGAGRYALETFPARWHHVINEALRIRRADRARPAPSSLIAGLAEFLPVGFTRDRRSLYATPQARRRDVLAFAEAVIADAHRLHSGGRGGKERNERPSTQE
ncbi:DNA polymerase III subunit beta [Planomonospora sphaerica]|uniref:DNA polymerase III subunit beta n=1 Tax=Planomonospora sphaerica TaxID=161355 RepID=A0A171DPK4_9ACTN|nr:nucleotidyltransferase domain-containing protein [Planomonospora sphaerica]GAT70981.1 DNA polymerase III subunit beta [Planomonospora sphaerica]